jgi:hypothetical protein
MAEFARPCAKGYGPFVEAWTRRRVLFDTTPARTGRWLALALVLHAPLTPVVGLLGLLRFTGAEDEVPTLPPVTEIPLDIIDDDTPPAGAEGATPPPAPPEPALAEPPLVKEPEAPAVKKPKPKEQPKDAGAETPDAGTAADAGAAPDAAEGDAGSERPPGRGIASPVAAVGDKRVVDPNANVQVLVHNDRVREHPLGSRIGPMLRNVYQWRDFFGPTAIDPMRDVDRMLLVGPQLRDSRDVVAVLQFNVPQATVRGAVDALVARDPEGGWLEGGVPTARAHADRAERIFVLPRPKILIVTPPSAQASAQRWKAATLPGPSGDEIAIAELATPWRAFLGLPVRIPKTIRSARLRLSAAPGGGVVIDVLAHDESEAAAASNARALTLALEAATSLDLGLLGSVMFGSSKKKFIDRGSFEPEGSDIRGEIVLSRSQVETALDLASGMLGAAAPRPRAVPSASAAAEPLSAPTTPGTAPPSAAPATAPPSEPSP